MLVIIMAMGTAACSKKETPVLTETVPQAVEKNSVEAFGVVKAIEIKNVNIDFSATVSQIVAREGQKVKRGDVLMSLDIEDYTTQINSKQHDLNTIRLEISKLQNKMIEADAAKSKDPDVRKLVNDLKYAEQAYQKVLKEQTDKEALYQSGAISKYELDEFIKSVDDKKKMVDDLSFNLDITMHSKEIGNKELTDNISIQRERAASLEKEIASMKEKLNETYIKGKDIVADVDNGVVFEIGYAEGDIVSPAKKALSMMNLNDMIVRANVSEEFIKDVKLGQKVEIIPVADKSKKYNGTVKMIANRAEVQNGETVIPVEISINNNDGFLMPEYNVDVEIFY